MTPTPSAASRTAPNGTLVLDQGKASRGGTVVMDHSLSETVAAPSQVSGFAAPSPSATTLSSASRTTVLPRLDDSAGEVRLVASEKPRYEHRGLLGQGGVGEVAKAHDHDIDRPVALKRLRADMRAPGHLARFVDEIRTIGSLEHPNIVPIHDVGLDEEGQYYFVMKYVDGETLEGILERLQKGDPLAHARFGIERRVEIFLGILEAVAYAHARGIIHRDLKPANIMVGPYGEVTVMDWGLAKRVRDPERALPPGPDPEPEPTSATQSAARTRVGTLLGTPAYMSPEQARGEALDERSDVYSLCVILHEMLGLRHYLDGSANIQEVLRGVLEKPAGGLAGTAPAELIHFLRKGLQKDKAQRYASVAEMIEWFRRRAEGEVPIQCHITFVQRMTREWSKFVNKHPLLVTLAMTACLVGMLGGGGWAIVRAVKGM